MELQYNKISELIEGQLPNFLQEEGPKFIKFVENYYEWMETSKLEVSVDGELNFLNIPENPIKIRGIDSNKIVNAEVLKYSKLDNGNYIFYLKEYSEDLNQLNSRGFYVDGDIKFLNKLDKPFVHRYNVTIEEIYKKITLGEDNVTNLQEGLQEGHILYQGDDLDTAIFQGVVEKIIPESNQIILSSSDFSNLKNEDFKSDILDSDTNQIETKIFENNFIESVFKIGDILHQENENGISYSSKIINWDSINKILKLETNPDLIEFDSNLPLYIQKNDENLKYSYDIKSVNEEKIKSISYSQNTLLSSKNLWNLQDIDRTLDEYVDFFMTEYLKGFPLSFPTQSESLDIDVEQFKKFLVKHSREFYQSKGTEDSFKYFFRSIFNEEVTVSYPKERVMSSSNNSFESTFTIFLEPNSNTVPDITSKKIKGQQSGVEYFVENVSLETISDYKVLKLELFKTTTISEFDLGETILDDVDQPIGKIYHGGSSIEILNTTDSFSPHQRFFLNRNGGLVEYKDIPNSQKGSLLEIMLCDVNSGDLTDINVSNGGTGYSVGQNLVFDNTNCFENEVYQRPIIASVSEVDENGTITKIKVRRVGRGYVKIPEITHIGDIEVTDEVLDIVSVNVGTIKDIKIKNSGFGYSLSEIELDLNNSGQNNIKLNFGSVFDDGGKFLNENSFLSDFKVLQDSSYYQTFSYVVESSLQIYKYKDLLKALIHPAGMKMFGTISSENKEDSRMVSVDSVLKIPFHIEKLINKYSDVPINKIHGNINRVSLYDGGENSDYANLPHEIFEGGGPPNEGAISDISDLHIDSVSSWSELHQVYKHKYLNLRAGFHEKSYFKFEEIKGLRASIDVDSKTASISKTFFMNVTKEDNRDFKEDDFIIGDVVYQGDSYETSISRSLIENWNSETGELELLKTQGDFDPSVEFKVNSYTKNILFDDSSLPDNQILNSYKKITLTEESIMLIVGDILYQGVDLANSTFQGVVEEIIPETNQIILSSSDFSALKFENFKSDILNSDTNQVETSIFENVSIEDFLVVDTRVVSDIYKKISLGDIFVSLEVGDVVYQGVDLLNSTFESEVVEVIEESQEIKVLVNSGETVDGNIKSDIFNSDLGQIETQEFEKVFESDFLKLEKQTYVDKLSILLEDDSDLLDVGDTIYQEDSGGNKTSEGVIINFISNRLIVSTSLGDFSENVIKYEVYNSETQSIEILEYNVSETSDFSGLDDSNYFINGETVFQGDYLNKTSEASVVLWDNINQELYIENITGQFSKNNRINKIVGNVTVEVNVEGLLDTEFLKNDVLYQGTSLNKTFESLVTKWDFENNLLYLSVLSGNFSSLEPLKFRKSQSIFEVLEIEEKITLNPQPELVTDDFLYKGVNPSISESYSTVVSLNGSDVVVETSLGEISVGDQLKSIKKYSISNLHKSFILQDKIDDDSVIYSYGNEFSVGGTVYQGDSLENSTFSGVVSYWDSVNKNLELDNTSGLIQNNQKLKKVLSNFNIIQSKELILILNQLEEDFLSNDFIFSQTITQQNNDGETASGEVLDWNHITGVLDLEILRPLDVDIVPKDFEIGYSVSGFNVNQVEKILDMGTLVDDILGEKFSSGDVIYQGDISNPTAEAVVLDWNNFEGILTIEPTEGLENFDKLDPFKIRTDSTNENFTIDKVINRLTLDKTKIPFTVDDFKSENGKIFQEQTLGQFGEVNLPFESDFVSWDENTGELRIDVTSGVFDSNLPVYQIDPLSPITNLFSISSTIEVVELDSTYSTNYLRNETVYQEDDSGNIIFEGVIDHWDSSDNKLKLVPLLGTSQISKVLKKEIDTFDYTDIREIFNVTDSSQFSVGDIFYQNDYDHSYFVLDKDGDKIYCGYNQDEMLDSNFVILKDGITYDVTGILQEKIKVDRNLDNIGVLDFQLGDFVIGETIYQGDISNPTAEATVINWDITNGEISINVTSGKFIKNESIKNNIEYDDFTIYGEITTGSTNQIKFGDSLSFVRNLNNLDGIGLFRVLNVDDLNNEIRLNVCSCKKHENGVILKRVSLDG